ncbi:MAG: hypothetical protein R2880_16335 [Deinococcales bacterium]
MDDLFGILFFIFFIVIPMINSFFKKKPGSKPVNPATPPVKPNQGPQIPTSTRAFSPKDPDFEKRLAEARQRVREAMTKSQADSTNRTPLNPQNSASRPVISNAPASTSVSQGQPISQPSSTSTTNQGNTQPIWASADNTLIRSSESLQVKPRVLRGIV